MYGDVKAGHPGVNGMLKNIKETYYFPQMYSLINDYVKNCTICQRLKIDHNKSNAPLLMTEILTAFHTLLMDHVGSNESKVKSENSTYRFLLVITE